MKKLYRGSLITFVVLAIIAPVGDVTAQSYDGKDRRVRVVNETSSATVWGFYASNIGEDRWQEDMLDDEVIPPGSSRRFNIDDGTRYCHYDFKAVMRYSGGRTTNIYRRNVNVCEVSTWTIYN